ncbi:MAG: hypothetical protein HQ547_05550 [Candidatus Omnitrophica bacterium]|nr:hypothetical protein [Candidatus Omnitrophota bacterium]
MTKGKICPICKKWFIPNKYRPSKQAICSSIECQYQRQLSDMKKWRTRNPEYFNYRQTKDASWKETCRQRALGWRKRHIDYLHLYRQQHKEQHRAYMREYMREWRQRKKEKGSNV